MSKTAGRFYRGPARRGPKKHPAILPWPSNLPVDARALARRANRQRPRCRMKADATHPRGAHGHRPRAEKANSAADAQPFDQRLVTLLVGTGEVIEQLATLGHELEQATPGVVVLDVGLEMLGEIADALRKDRHLHLRRTRVAGLGRISLDDFRLAGGCDRHRNSFGLSWGDGAQRQKPRGAGVGRAGMSSST